MNRRNSLAFCFWGGSCEFNYWIVDKLGGGGQSRGWREKKKAWYKWLWWRCIWLQLTRPSYPHVTLSPIHFSFSPPLPPPLPPPWYASATFFLPHLLLSPLNSLSVSFSIFFFFFLPFCYFTLLCFVSFSFVVIVPFSSSYFPSLHSRLCPTALGLLASTKVFSHPSSPLSLRLPPSLSLSPRPLIFMRLTGQPCSASLSLSVGEEAA